MIISYSLLPFLVFIVLVSSACFVPLAAPPTPTPPAEAVVIPSPTPIPAATATPTALPTNTPVPAPVDTPTPVPSPTPTSAPRLPFDGTFEGVINGDAGSSAVVSIDMTQTGTNLAGTATVGEGLLVDVGGGFCPGVQEVPATTMDLAAETSASNPRHLEESSNLVVRGYTIGIKIVVDVSAEGDVMNVRMDLLMPWPCRSVTMQAALARTG
jgi:hypothetical protein